MGIHFFIPPFYLGGLQKYSLSICGLFWDVKNGKLIFLGEISKTRDTKRAHEFHRNCGLFQKISSVHNSKSKLCTRLFKNNNNFQNLGDILVCLFCGALKLDIT